MIYNKQKGNTNFLLGRLI